MTLGTGVLNPLNGFRFTVRENARVISSITELANVSRPYMLGNLVPYTRYTVGVTARNSEGFGGVTSVSFTTAEEGNDLFIYFKGKGYG